MAVACGSADRQAPPRYVEVGDVPGAGTSAVASDAGSAASGGTLDGGMQDVPSHLGVVIRSVYRRDWRAGQRGLLVLRVVADSPAAHAGLRPGDLILSADGKPLKHTMTLVHYVRGVPPGVAVRLKVVRDGTLHTFDIVTAPRPDEKKDERGPR